MKSLSNKKIINITKPLRYVSNTPGSHRRRAPRARACRSMLARSRRARALQSSCPLLRPCPGAREVYAYGARGSLFGTEAPH